MVSKITYFIYKLNQVFSQNKKHPNPSKHPISKKLKLFYESSNFQIMEEYLPKLETKMRKLVLDLIEPTIRRNKEQGELIDQSQKAIDMIQRKIEFSEIIIDRINSKLTVIDEFSKRLVQLDQELRVADVKFEAEREKLRGQLDVMSSRISDNEQFITVLQGKIETVQVDQIGLSHDLNLTKTLFGDKTALLKIDIDKNLKVCQDYDQGLAVNISNLDKRCSVLSNDLEEYELTSKKALRNSEAALEKISNINDLITASKTETKAQVDKIRMLAIQYNQQAMESLKKFKDQVHYEIHSEVPIKMHIQASEMLYQSFPDIKIRKQIAEAEAKCLEGFEYFEIPKELKEKLEECKVRVHEIRNAELPRETPRKKKKLNLSDLLNMSTTIKTHEEKMKEMESKITTIEEKASHRNESSGTTILERILERHNSSSSSEFETDAIASSEVMKQNAAALAQFIGVKDYTEEIQAMRDSLERNYSEFSDFQTETTEFSQRTITRIMEINDKILGVNDRQDDFYTQMVLLKASLENTSEEVDKVDRRHQKNSEELGNVIGKTRKDLQESIDNAHGYMKNYIENTKNLLMTIEYQVSAAVNEVNASSAQRKRDKNDNKSEFMNLNLTAESILKQIDNFKKTFESVGRSINLITEYLRINISLQFQDELDRESIALIGYKEGKQGHSRGRSGTSLGQKPSVSLDKQCISCSGQVNLITSAFKIACLAYTPSLVNFRDSMYQRTELLEIQKKMVEGIINAPLASEVSCERIRLSKTPKPAWRPPSSLSMYVNSGVVNTPDLPPISLSKRISNY